MKTHEYYLTLEICCYWFVYLWILTHVGNIVRAGHHPIHQGSSRQVDVVLSGKCHSTRMVLGQQPSKVPGKHFLCRHDPVDIQNPFGIPILLRELTKEMRDDKEFKTQHMIITILCMPSPHIVTMNPRYRNKQALIKWLAVQTWRASPPRIASASGRTDAVCSLFKGLAFCTGRARIVYEARILATTIKARVDFIAVRISQTKAARTRNSYKAVRVIIAFAQLLLKKILIVSFSYVFFQGSFYTKMINQVKVLVVLYVNLHRKLWVPMVKWEQTQILG